MLLQQKESWDKQTAELNGEQKTLEEEYKQQVKIAHPSLEEYKQQVKIAHPSLEK